MNSTIADAERTINNGKAWNDMTQDERDAFHAAMATIRGVATARKARKAAKAPAAVTGSVTVVTRQYADHRSLAGLVRTAFTPVMENTRMTATTATTTVAQDWQAASAIKNGTYTLVGPKGRRTVEVETIKPGQHGVSPFVSKFLGQRVVKLLTGPDNTSDYTMIGWLKPGDKFVATARNIGTDNEKIGLAFIKIVTTGIDGYEFLLSSTCRRCGRKLTVPSSIDDGVGPDCAGMGAFAL